jgi:hypothetical protein
MIAGAARHRRGEFSDDLSNVDEECKGWGSKPGFEPVRCAASKQATRKRMLVVIGRPSKLALPPGIYNIAADDSAVAIEKARKELGFDPPFSVPASVAY